MPSVRFIDLSSFDQINLGATLVQTAVMIAFAVAVAGVWLTQRRPAMRALSAYWGLFACAAALNVFSSWSGAIWRDRILSLSLTTLVVALHAAAVPFARATMRRLADDTAEAPVARTAMLWGLGVCVLHGVGIWAALRWVPDVRLVPVIWSRALHAIVFAVPAGFAWQQQRVSSRNRLSMLLLAVGFTALAVRGVLELALGLRAGMPDLPPWAEAAAILFNLLGLIALGVASLIAMAAEEEAIVRRQSDDLQRAERVLQEGQRLESLGRLAGGVAHDFNNVLAVVMATADNLREDALTAGQLTEIDEIRAAADRGRSLVRQLLTFARQQPARTETFIVDAQLGELRTMLTRLAKGVELHIALDADSAQVHMDRSQFDQVLLNLVVNARDACDAGGRIAVSSTVRHDAPLGVLAARTSATRTAASPMHDAWICIGVNDTGSGIPADILPNIFEPFFSTKTEERGTGLGLSTVMGIVARAGGDMVVASTPGSGTQFEIWLPLAAASAAQMATAATPSG